MQTGQIIHRNGERLRCTRTRQSGLHTFQVIDLENKPIIKYYKNSPAIVLDHGIRLMTYKTKKMRIIFVGIHYKKGKQAFDSYTKSGKIIDLIISKLKYDCIKTNLYSKSYMPKKTDKPFHAVEWYRLNNIRVGLDVAILLGREVQENFNYTTGIKTISIPHPASIFGNDKRKEYILNAIEKINER